MDPILDAKFILRDYFKKSFPELELPDVDKIFVTHHTYSIGNPKTEMAVSSTPGYLFQVTHNKDCMETYLDVYKKESNTVYIDDGNLREISSEEAVSRPDVGPPDCGVCSKEMVWSMGTFVCNEHVPAIRAMV